MIEQLTAEEKTLIHAALLFMARSLFYNPASTREDMEQVRQLEVLHVKLSKPRNIKITCE